MTAKRVLFYVDTPSMLEASIEAAEALRLRTGASIVMLLVDSAKHRDARLASYEVHDYSVLIRSRCAIGMRDWLRQRRRLLVHYMRLARVTVLTTGPANRMRERYPKLDSAKHRDARLASYEVHDYSVLIRSRGAIGMRDWLRQRRRLLVHYMRLARVTVLTTGPANRMRERYPKLWRSGKMATKALGYVPATLAYGGMKLVYRIRRRNRGAVGSVLPPTGFSGLRAALRRLLGPMAQALSRQRFIRAGTRGVRTFLDKVRPDAIVVLEDNIQTLSRFFVEEARRRRLPTIILPFTIPNPKEAALFYKGNPSYAVDSAFKRAFIARRPHWHHDHEGQAMLRLPIDQAIAYELRGYATSRPWVLNLGPAAAIALESEAMWTAYAKLGFPMHVLKVIGEPIGKVLHRGLTEREALRKWLCLKHDLDPSLPLIICGFPPDQYNSNDTSGFEFASFEAMVEGWMATFATLGRSANVVMRPHPRLDPKLLLRHAGENVRVSTAPTAELIPLGDIYVASISATIRWAIASGVPVVNYDCYRYRYDDFASADGVIAVENQSDFREQLVRLVHDEVYLASVRARQRAIMAYWGIADDQFGQRFANMAQELFEEPAVQSAAAVLDQAQLSPKIQ